MEGIRFDKTVLRFMVPLEGMVTSETLQVKNFGDVAMVYKVIRSSDRFHFLVQPRMGKIEPGGVTKIIFLFRGGLIRRRSSLRIDFAPLSSPESRALTAAEFWNPKDTHGANIGTVPISKTTFKIEIVEFNEENGLFETQLFASANDGSDVKTVSAFSTKSNRVGSSADMSAISHLVRRASVVDETSDAFVTGNGDTANNFSTRIVKQNGRGIKRVGSGGDSARLGRMGTFTHRRGTLCEAPAGNTDIDNERTPRSWRSLRRLKRPSGSVYSGFGSMRSFRHVKLVDEESYVRSTGPLRHKTGGHEHSDGNRNGSTHTVSTRSFQHPVHPREDAASAARTRSHYDASRAGRMKSFRDDKGTSLLTAQINSTSTYRVNLTSENDLGNGKEDGSKKRNVNRVGRKRLIFSSTGPSQDGILLENYSDRTQTYRVRTTDSALFLADPNIGILKANSTAKINCIYTGLPFPENATNFFQVDVANSNTQNPAMFWEAQAQVKPKVVKLLFEVKFQLPEPKNERRTPSPDGDGHASYEGSEQNLSVPKRALSNMLEEEERQKGISPTSESEKKPVFLPYFALTSPPRKNADVLPRLTSSSGPLKKDDVITSIASSTELPDLPSQPSSRQPSANLFAPYTPSKGRHYDYIDGHGDISKMRRRKEVDLMDVNSNSPSPRSWKRVDEVLDVSSSRNQLPDVASQPPSRKLFQPRYSTAPPPPEKGPIIPSCLPLPAPPDPREDFLIYHHPPSPPQSPSSPVSRHLRDVYSPPPSWKKFLSAHKLIYNNSNDTEEGSGTPMKRDSSAIPFFGSPAMDIDIPTPEPPMSRADNESFARRNYTNEGEVFADEEEASGARRTKSGAAKSCGLRQSNLRSSRRRTSKLKITRTLSDAWSNIKRESSSFRRRRKYSNNNNSSNSHTHNNSNSYK